MAASLRQKLTILILALYWPAFFVLTHIPIPESIRRAHVSDKCLHILGYMLLTFLLWYAFKPQRKVRWREASPWLVVLVVLLYGIADEVIQGFVGRSCDVRDLAADMIGAIIGLSVMSIFTFWPAGLVVTGFIIFGISNVSKVNLASVIPFVSSSFHLFAYGTFTSFWIWHTRLFDAHNKLGPKSLTLALGMPIGFLAFVSFSSLALGRTLSLRDTMLSLLGIGLAVLVFSIISIRCKPRT
jgi:VanZ family protein